MAEDSACGDATIENGVLICQAPAVPPLTCFGGNRHGVVEDPFGHQWPSATHQHNYTPEQIPAYAKKFMARMPGGVLILGNAAVFRHSGTSRSAATGASHTIALREI
jgi:hypothetical protein